MLIAIVYLVPLIRYRPHIVTHFNILSYEKSNAIYLIG